MEHLLFQLVGALEERAPGLVDRLEASIDHLGDPADDDTRDDEAVRAIARKFLAGLKRA